ncbi:MAG TPA: metallophosphoesterase [Thermoplasmata archaeon]|nr:metallophosphoesterase [Thermoplasmata archaeon]
MKPVPVQDEAALFIPQHGLLVMADLHVGIEYMLYEQGIHVGSRVNRLVEHVKDVVAKTRAEELLILGDVKHVVPGSPFSQKKDLEYFFKEFEKELFIHIVPGNHDGGIEKLVSKHVRVHSSSGWMLEEESIGFVHGHRWPSERVMRCSTLVVAHTHPTVRLKDKLGYRFSERCWVNTTIDYTKVGKRYSSTEVVDVIVMPAFNPLCGGIPVNTEGLIGPVGRVVDLDLSRVYLLDGSYLGRVMDLR